MAKKDKQNKKSGGTGPLKTVLAFAIITVIIGGMLLVLFLGIIDLFKDMAKEAVEQLGESASNGIKWLGLAQVKAGMQTFVVNQANVTNLRNQLDSQNINADTCGMTEVRIRKMLLAYAVSNSLSDTVCAVETPEEQIIRDFKESNRSYKNDESITVEDIMDIYAQKNGSRQTIDIWTAKDINYTLYYNSKKFFYFKDKDKKFGENENAWFLGAMGATSITTSEGENLKPVTELGFEEIKKNFNAANSPLDSEAYKDMLTAYIKTGPDTIKMYTVDVKQKEYYFCFENKNIGKIEEPKQKEDGKITYSIDADSTYDIGTQEINLTESIDLSKYSIPIELMMDLLNMTGSGEFLETFIDYALSQIGTSVTAYSLSTESKQYEQKKYNIDSDFVIELYDMDDSNGYEEVADGYKIGNTVYNSPIPSEENIVRTNAYGDNFLAYYDIIYNRKYNGIDIPNNRVTSIKDYKEIRYKDEDKYNYENPNKDVCKAKALEEYLKIAYEPMSDLGEIKVTEVICRTLSQNKWQLMVSGIDTWYGNFTYNLLGPETLYATPDKLDNSNKEDYEAYNHTNMKLFNDVDDEEKEIIYIWEDLLKQVKDSYLDANKVANKQKSQDIYDNAMKTENGKDNREHFQNWAMRGLTTIAQNDGGEKKGGTGVGKGCDYIYCKYKKINVKEATPVTKTAKQIINENNIQMTSSTDDIDKKMKQFLALLRNETGKIPDPLNSGVFTARNADPSIVVKYSDIYEGTIPAGDLLLDNGALMLFNLLENSDNTQELVNIFKYLAYLYTGEDYGVTSATEIATLFNTYQYSGTNYIVNTALSSKDIVLEEKQLKEAISKCFSRQGRTNLENCIPQFMEIQNNNHVNAVFAVAVTTIESSNGTNWDAIDPSTYNWFSVKGSNEWKSYSSFGAAVLDFGNLINGSNYFKNGKVTVKDIAPIYCNESWGNNVIAEMTRIYNSIGISVNTGGTEGQQGSVTTFTVGNRTYINYKQIVDGYKNIPLAGYPKTNLYDSGCAITSDAIIASGFGSKDTPVEVNNFAKKQSNPNDHPSIIKHYTGKNATWVTSGNLKDGVVNQLKNGYPVMVHVSMGKFAIYGEHFFTVLSISEDGKKVYVSNPNSRKDGVLTGWVNTNDLNTIDRYLKME